jgi:FMN-binding domain
LSARWPAFIAAPVVLTVPAAHATVYLSVKQAQQSIFPGARFNALQHGGRERIWQAKPGGWFIIDQALGKRELITYAVGIDTQGRLRGVEILEYRESHGGEVRDAKWRAQFVGKTSADPLALDRDIRNISGATLSCRHITDGIKRLLKLYETSLAHR